jgi:hypothetical protein
MSLLAERLLAIDQALNGAGVPHAFGGAIALAYCTAEPRATIDLDLNIFIANDRAADALSALPHAVQVTADNRRELASSGQTRVWWDSTPVDLFFDTHPFHGIAASRVRRVPFAQRSIPVLDCTSLAVFKARFNRTKDWADLEAMADAGQLDIVAVGAFLADLLGDDPRLARLAALG